MLLLAFDTSAKSVSVALLNDSKIMASKSLLIERGQGEALMPLIQEVLKTAGVTAKDITDVAVSVGPGSFTGVRVGLAAARGIALALGIPAHGVTTFEIAAYGLNRPLQVVLDTKRGDFYTQRFLSDQAEPCEAKIQTAEEIESIMENLTGDGVALLSEQAQLRGVDHHIMPAEVVAYVAASRLKNPLPAEPIYLRDADVTV